MRLQLLFLLLLTALPAFSQVSLKDTSITIPMFSAFAGYQQPKADLEKRFGANGVAGGSFILKTSKGWLFGFDGSFIFGNQVKDTTILDHLESEAGFVISQNGLAMDVFVLQRGFMFTARAGYVFPVLRNNPNSGPFVSFGAGFWQHRVRLEQKYGETPALAKEYRKGYDRLTNGLVLSQLIGYHFFSDSRFTNFYLAAEINEGFLQGRRDILFDTGKPGNEARFDMTLGARFGWVIPIYERKKSSSRYLYY